MRLHKTIAQPSCRLTTCLSCEMSISFFTRPPGFLCLFVCIHTYNYFVHIYTRETICECGTEPQDSISLEVSYTGTFRSRVGEIGEWRSLHKEELHSLYRSPNIVRVIKSRRLRCAGHVARMEEGRSAFNILIDKTTGKRPSGRPRLRQEDNIRIRGNTRMWVDSAQDRHWRALVNAALNLRVP